MRHAHYSITRVKGPGARAGERSFGPATHSNSFTTSALRCERVNARLAAKERPPVLAPGP